MSLDYCIAEIDCLVDPWGDVDRAALDISNKIKRGGRIIQSIVKYYRVIEVQYSGTSWFDSKGNLVDKVDDKQALYKNRIQYQGEVFGGGHFFEYEILFN